MAACRANCFQLLQGPGQGLGATGKRWGGITKAAPHHVLDGERGLTSKAVGGQRNKAVLLPSQVCAQVPVLLSLNECVFRDFTSEHRTSLGRRLQGHRALRMENAHKTPRPVLRRPAQCHPERGPGWLRPKPLPGPPSQAQATEEALMAKEAPGGLCSWCNVGTAGPWRGRTMIPAALNLHQTSGPKSEHLWSVCVPQAASS